MRKNYPFILALILLSIICIDFYLKISCSNNSVNIKNYIDLYESKNLYRLSNIYYATFINIILGAVSIFLLLKSLNLFKTKLIIYTLVIIASLLVFLNLFSLL